MKKGQYNLPFFYRWDKYLLKQKKHFWKLNLSHLMPFNQSCLAVLATNTPSYYCVVFSALAKLLDEVWTAWFKSVVALSSTCLGCSPIDDVSFDAMAKGAEAALLLAWLDAMTCWVRCDDIRLKIASAVMPNIAKIMSNFGYMRISSVASIWLTDV